MAKALDIETMMGRKFHRWTIISHAGFKYYSGQRRHMVNVRCECGNESEVLYESLTRANNPSKSCGCLKSESTAKRNTASTTHGKSCHELYGVWLKMVRRCTNPRDAAYKDYGARGITVCDSWGASVESFIIDMGERPPGTSLDRIDNDQGYNPDNCRWSSRVEQANNRRCSVKYSCNGETLGLSEMSGIYGIPVRVLRNRIVNLGWTPERAVAQDVRSRNTPKVQPDKIVAASVLIDSIADILNMYGIYRRVVERVNDIPSCCQAPA